VMAACFTFTVTTASRALWVYWMAALVVLLMASISVWKRIPAEVKIARSEFQTGQWVAVALPMMVGGITQIIMNRSGTLLLGAMVDMETVGLFTAANRLSNLNTFILGAISTITMPMLAASFHGGRKKQLSQVMRQAILWSACGSLPLFLIMVIWPDFLLGLFGTSFKEGAPLLRVLALGQYVNAATGPVGLNLLMSGKERKFALSIVVITAVNILASYLVIPHYGSIGVAWVTAASVAVLNGWLLFLTIRFSQI